MIDLNVGPNDKVDVVPEVWMIGIDIADDDFDVVLERVAHSGTAGRFQLVLKKKFKFILPQSQLQRRRLSSLFDRGMRFERNPLFEKNSEYFYMT